MRKYNFILVIAVLFLTIPVTAQVNIPNGDETLPLPISIITPPSAYPAGIIVNSVETHTPTIPLQDANNLNGPSDQVTTVYTDGLGRVIQTVNKKMSAVSHDIVQPVYYDSFGRQPARLLPYVSDDNNGNFKHDAFNASLSYNSQKYPNESAYYARTAYDDNTLLRGTKIMKPGANGAATNMGVTQQMMLNDATDEVRLWNNSSSGIPYTNGIWPANSLAVSETVGENGMRVRTYLDKGGKTILTKKELLSTHADSHDGWLSNYYVYDDLGRLSNILTPKVIDIISTSGWTLTQAMVDDLCYTYNYDNKGRVISKKLPGVAELRCIYDQSDRLVLCQDGILSAQNKWKFIKYDGLGRNVLTGIFLNSNNLSQQNIVIDVANASPTSPFIQFLLTPLTENNYTPSSTIPDGELLTINYFDDYNNTPSGYEYCAASLQNLVGNNAVAATRSFETTGMPTGGYIRVMDVNGTTSQWLSGVMYYDGYGQMIQKQSTNFKGGRDTVNVTYNFNGLPVLSYTSVNNPSSSVPELAGIHTTEAVVYDKNLRPVKLLQKINDEPNYHQIQMLTYDDFGRVLVKRLGQNAETQTFSYRVWGDLEAINKNYCENGYGNHFFGEILNYDYGYTSLNSLGIPSGMRWRMKGSGNIQRSYGYSYDAVGRLKSGYYTQNNGTGWTNTQENYTASDLAYDPNGNLTHMEQWGTRVGNGQPFKMDELTLKYMNGGVSNQLQATDDAVPNNFGLGEFVEQGGAGSTTDYGYDENGNITQDVNRNISNITYNDLNKPLQITFATGGRSIRFAYDANGNLLSKTISETGRPDQVLEYLSSVQYQNDKLVSIAHKEGRVRPVLLTLSNNTTQWSFEYDYFVKDHQDNVRSTITEEVDDNWNILAVTPDVQAATATPCTTCSYVPGSDGSDGVEVLSGHVMGTRSYKVTSELINAPVEEANFENVADTRDEKPLSSDPNDTKDTRLNEDEGKIIGPSIMLKVAAGDKISVKTGVYYELKDGADNSSYTSTEQLVNGLVNALSGQGGYQTINEGGINSEFAGGALSSCDFLSTMQALKANANSDGTKPQAFLNYLVLDDNMQIVTDQSGFLQAHVPGSWNLMELPEMELQRSGYVVVFLSNESKMSVHFDNLNLTHYKGKLLEESHYYPYGLTITSKAFTTASENRNLLGGKTLQKNEFANLSGLDWYDFGARQYDAQIGRWNGFDPLAESTPALSPYNYCNNNPVVFTDPDGMQAERPKLSSIKNDQQTYGSGGSAGWYIGRLPMTFGSPGNNQSNSSGSGASYSMNDLINWVMGSSSGDVSIFNNINGKWDKQVGGKFQVGSYANLGNGGFSFTAGFFYGINADGSPSTDVNGMGGSFETITIGGSIGKKIDRTSPWGVGWEWLTGTGPREHNFTGDDPFTQLLMKHEHIAETRALIGINIATGIRDNDGKNPYKLGGAKGVGLYIRDYSTLVTLGYTGNIAVTYLGSYVLSWKITSMDLNSGVVNVDFDVSNASTIQSATHPPIIGYGKTWSKYIGKPLDNIFSSGPMSKTVQNFHWSETIHYKK